MLREIVLIECQNVRLVDRLNLGRQMNPRKTVGHHHRS